MKRLRALLLVLVFLAVPMLQAAASPAMTPIRPEPKPVTLVPIAEQIGQQIQSLVNPIGTAAPAAAAPATVPATPGDTEEGAEPAPTFGTRALNLVIVAAEILRAQGQIFITNFAALPQLSGWFDAQTTDPRLIGLWNDVGHDLITIVGVSLLGALALELILYPARAPLRRRKPARWTGKVGTLFGLFILRAIPLLVFAGAAATLLDQNETHKFPRFIILSIVYALTLSRAVISAFRGILSPVHPDLRPVPMATPHAVYAFRWLRAFAIVIIAGYFCVDVAHAARMPEAALTALTNIFGLMLVVMTITVIVQKRAYIAALLRGNLSAAQSGLTLRGAVRLWLARHWHRLALGYLVIGYAIAALGVQNGFALLLRGTILTLLVLAALQFALIGIGRWGQRDATAGAAIHHMVLRFLARILIWAIALVACAAAWGADIPMLFATQIGQHILGSAFSIGVSIVVLTVIYELFSSVVDKQMDRRGEDNAYAVSARTRTLLPMVRNTVFIVFGAIIALVALSEAGINIAPLLAGAGVLGVAVGFGSQTLVKDFLTGLFIVIENTVAIGDVVKIGDHSGVVEAMGVRTMRLRDQDGSLHTLAFSEVTQIINMTKDFAFAVIKIGVAYTTDLDKAMNAIRAVGEEMQQDPLFKRVILDGVEILGIDALGDYSVTLLARMRTRPGKQWDVKRMFLLKLKLRFDKEGIEIPLPTSLQYVRTEKKT